MGDDHRNCRKRAAPRFGLRSVAGVLHAGHAAKLILTGTLIGLAFAFMTTHLLAAMLYHVSPYDLTTFAFVTVVLGAIALVASYIPTSRVIRTDPMLALAHTA